MSSGHGPELSFQNGQRYYLLLKKNAASGNWKVAAPTAGQALITPDGMRTTYRHSYHQALVAPDLYERPMSAIFQFLHGKPVDQAAIENLFDTALKLPPQDIPADLQEKEKAERFFTQHVLLECFYYFGTEVRADLLEPFLRSEGYHVKISAVRALSAIKSERAKQHLLEFLVGPGNGFAKVMAVWGLRRQQAKETLPKLIKIEQTLKDEKTGFGGSIMDPRVGTIFPSSVRGAISELVAEWQEKKKS